MSQAITQGQLDVLISYLRSVDTDTLSFEGREAFVKAFNYVMQTRDIPKIQQLHALFGPKVVDCVKYMGEHHYDGWKDNDYESTDELFAAVTALFEEVIET
tara:strand:- start:45 stop:347 length:303 start_codon:yes stop_codon:yes gene_type:complete